MEKIEVGLGGQLRREYDPGVESLGTEPDLLKALERGTVVKTTSLQGGIQVGEVELLAIERRPRRSRGVGGKRGNRAQNRRSEAGRGGDGVLLGEAVEDHRAMAGGVGRLDRELDLNGAGVGKDQREKKTELGNGGQTQVVGEEQSPLDKGSAGKQGERKDAVVGEPGVRAEGEASGEKQRVIGGQRNDGAEKRVVCGAQTRGRQLSGVMAGGEPEALPLERIGRKGEARRQREGKGDRSAVGIKVGGGGQELGELTVVTTERGDDQAGKMGRGESRLKREGKNWMGADLDEVAEALGEEKLNGLTEENRLTEVLVKVLRVELGTAKGS